MISKILIISSSSKVEKTSLIEKILEKYPEKFKILNLGITYESPFEENNKVKDSNSFIQLLDIDVKTTKEFINKNKNCYEFVKIFLFKKLDKIEKNLKSKNDYKDNDIKNEKEEIINASGIYDYYIENSDLEETFKKFSKIIDSNFKIKCEFDIDSYNYLLKNLKTKTFNFIGINETACNIL